MKKVLVYGWYNQKNFGDDLFIEAFKTIFPTLEFTFTDHISGYDLGLHDTIFFGGGSFLNQDIKISDHTLLYDKKIFYIGVGAETLINKQHFDLLRRAQMIFIRSDNLEKIKKINSNAYQIKDLVYVLSNKIVFSSEVKKQILFCPNICVVPKWTDPHWQHTAWEHFKNEMAQTLDAFADNKYEILCFPMCINSSLNDASAMAEINNRMVNRSKVRVDSMNTNLELISSRYKNVEFIITQRYHGIVLAELMSKPCISIFHHDKLKNANSVPYYGFYKDLCMNSIIESIRRAQPLIESNIEWRSKVLSNIGE